MNNNKSAKLIEKLIYATKDNSILWVNLSISNISLKPLPSTKLNDSLFSSISSSVESLNGPSLSTEDSYVGQLGDGYFFLLLYQNMFNNNHLILRVQTKSSSNSRIYATSNETEENLEISSQLKRLYNLINDSYCTKDIDSFINQFIKSE